MLGERTRQLYKLKLEAGTAAPGKRDAAPQRLTRASLGGESDPGSASSGRNPVGRPAIQAGTLTRPSTTVSNVAATPSARLQAIGNKMNPITIHVAIWSSRTGCQAWASA